MSYPVRVYGPILNQSLSQYWSVLQNVRYILRTPNYTGHCHSCVPCGAAWKCLHGWIFSPPVRT